MQPTRRPTNAKASALLATLVAVPVVGMLLAAGFSTPSHAAPLVAGSTNSITTAWADSVRAHLGGQSDSQSAPTDVSLQVPSSPTGTMSPHPITVWARTVEAHLADRAHRVANAGRSALAWSESGVASWYGGRRAGRRTSSGQRFDPMQLTCAHPTLPLGTKVLVTSESTGRSVVVTVNDRGPFGGRIVDLSRAAAARIGMLGSGTASVTLAQASPEAVEVAEAADSDTSREAIAVAGETGADISPAPRDQRHRLRDGR